MWTKIHGWEMNTEKSDSIPRKEGKGGGGGGEKVQEKGKPDRHSKRFSPVLVATAEQS